MRRYVLCLVTSIPLVSLQKSPIVIIYFQYIYLTFLYSVVTVILHTYVYTVQGTGWHHFILYNGKTRPLSFWSAFWRLNAQTNTRLLDQKIKDLIFYSLYPIYLLLFFKGQSCMAEKENSLSELSYLITTSTSCIISYAVVCLI